MLRPRQNTTFCEPAKVRRELEQKRRGFLVSCGFVFVFSWCKQEWHLVHRDLNSQLVVEQCQSRLYFALFQLFEIFYAAVSMPLRKAWPWCCTCARRNDQPTRRKTDCCTYTRTLSISESRASIAPTAASTAAALTSGSRAPATVGATARLVVVAPGRGRRITAAARQPMMPMMPMPMPMVGQRPGDRRNRHRDGSPITHTQGLRAREEGKTGILDPPAVNSRIFSGQGGVGEVPHGAEIARSTTIQVHESGWKGNADVNGRTNFGFCGHETFSVREEKG